MPKFDGAMSCLKELGRGSCRKIKPELKAKFLPRHYYLQDNFTGLHNIRQEERSVEEYTCDFERLLMTCDLRESEDQTIVS